jgi:GntR family transcriptional regulator, transcriptional repressor for pyruvate dehydrogenase complex
MQLAFIAPIERKTASSAIVQQIQQLIAENRLKPGDRLGSERDLAASLGVSRSTLREAIKTLQSTGILEVRQGAGTFVCEAQARPFSNLGELGSIEKRKLLKQVSDARRLIDVEVAGLAAKVGNAELIADIRKHIENSNTHEAKVKAEFSLDLNFEALIAKAAENPFLLELQRSAHTMFATAWVQGGFIPRPADVRNEQHELILQAIERGDTQQARLLMTQHFEMGIMPEEM